MNKILSASFLVGLVLVSLIGCQPIKRSKAYEFTSAVLDSLSLVQIAQEEARKTEPKSLGDMEKKLKTQIRLFSSAKSKITTYLSDERREYNTVAKGMEVGIDGLIKVNKDTIDLMKINIDDYKAMANEVKRRERKLTELQAGSYKILGLSSAFAGYVIFSPRKTNNPKAKIPYNVTATERQLLSDKIEKVFGANLKKYYIYSADHSKGSPSDQNWIVFSVDEIKNYLIPDTYEEARALSKSRH